MGERSQKLGLTIGVWDLWHVGHENFLSYARSECDFLFVGIMTDFWCHVQKGHNRPYESLQHRLMNLRNSYLADKIVIIDTLDIHNYLQMVDVWIKGEDQRNMRPLDWPNTVFIERTEGVSTTQKGLDEHYLPSQG